MLLPVIMKRATLQTDFLLLLAAAIWGFAFVAQRAGMDHVGPFFFNGVRFALGALVLLPLIASRGWTAPSGFPALMRDGLLAGLVLFAGASLQQWGVVSTTAGKAGFITGLYLIIVPILGLFLGQATRRATWLGAVIALIGLYLLTAQGGLRIGVGDLLVLSSAFFWALHVQLIARFVARQDAFALAATQFAVVSLLSLLAAGFFEADRPQSISGALWPILYAGLASTGIAYTLQVVAQRRAHPSHAAIILGLEAVFAVLGGWWLLGEGLGGREMLGCALMLAGMLLSQRGALRD